MAVFASHLYYPVNGVWKTFVRETTVENEKITDTYNSQLNFHGDEAKIIYETIINDDKLQQFNNIKKSKCNSKIHETIGKNADMNDVKSKKIVDNFTKVNVEIDANKILKAVEQRDLKFLMDKLTKKNVNIVDNYGWTPLMSAAYCGTESIVKFLLKLGANKECKDKSGFTALQLAQKKNHFNIMYLLTTKQLTERKKKYSQNNFKIDEFYCIICKATFKETTVKKHETSTLHLFNTNPKLCDPIYGIPMQNKGYQIMINNGWEKSRGLGPTGSGLKYPIKTVLKRDRKGLGHEPKGQARVTHPQINDTKQLNMKNDIKNYIRNRDRDKVKNHERKKEIAIRQALS